MYYRYEIKNNKSEFVGIFSVFNPSQRRYFNRFLKEPKWYKNNPDKKSRCWFTEVGYQKYHTIIENLISELRNPEIRLLKMDTLKNIVVNGKIQCIELIEQEKHFIE